MAYLRHSVFLGILFLTACSSDDDPSGASTTGGSGGTGATGATGGFNFGGSSAGAGGSAGSATGGSAGSGATGGSAGSATGGSAGAGGVAGSGGVGGAAGSGTGGVAGSGGGAGTPNCDAQPSGTATKSIKQIWTDNPSAPAAVWVPNVVVTALSGGGCSFGNTCQVMVQQDDTYVSFAAGAQNAIRVEVQPTYAGLFAAANVGSRINLYGWASRHTNDGKNELYIDVGPSHPGCAKVVGTSTPSPITGVLLTDLTLNAYEVTHGPLLVRVDAVSGSPNKPNETFALWKQGVFTDSGIEEVVSVSPFYLSNYAFTGLTEDLIHNFQSITGVFGLFVPAPAGPKYKQLLIRTMSDAPFGGQ